MEREEAIERIRLRINGMSWCIDDEDKKALETLIPELAGSEDERIKKELIEYLTHRAELTGFIDEEKDCKRWITYLEKQKDEAQRQYNLGVQEGREKAMYELEKERKEPLPIPNKFSGLKSLMLQYLQSAANRKDDAEIESDTDLWGRKILDYVWKYDGTQKEQKPVEASGTAEPDYGICDDYIPASLHHALKRHGWYAGHVGEEEEFVLQRRKYVERNWPADKNNLTQEQKEQKTDGKAKAKRERKAAKLRLNTRKEK